ncbi:hypothetical protein CIB93_34360 [Streptomyces sp. WZ.A104]|uniref:hypothetical protein n=1 Tax=Streptomyces sp. WZ.A104 TaxID=2023771 RepID=UPI000BBC0B5B|nr:hypothetical protein [Streptomyces sp. WZ.A104]PCG81645.1 hypothetical protein CIB93_34360 [Streptomyces sp. WZ.A104]
MAQTENTRRNTQHNSKHNKKHGTAPGTTLRRTLRREAPSTIGLLVDAQDFAAMRHYRTFPFDDHTVYLQQVEALLKTLTAQGMHTTIALFDPEDYAEFCAESGLDADTGASRSRFTAEIAAAGATVAYTGQRLSDLIPLLVSRAVRQATWEYATLLLADLGACADCGQDIGRAAFDRASHLLLRLLEAAGPGTHHLVCSTPTEDDQLLAVLNTHRDPTGPTRMDSSEGAEFATVLAVAVALESRGGVVLRTSAPDSPDRVHGWRLAHGTLAPLTAGEVFNAYCTDAETGEPVSPESGVEYCAGFDIRADPAEPHH